MAGDLLYIKVARTDGNGNDLTDTLETLSNITLPSGSSFNTYTINSATRTNDYYLYYVTAPDRKDIDNVDKSDLLYSFSGSYNTNISLNNINSLLPIVTSSVDNLNFFIPAGTTSSLGYPRNIGSYKIPTLPNKNLDIRISSSIQFLVEGSRSTTTDVTASIRILSTPFVTNNPQNPTVLAEQVLTQSAQDLDGTDLLFTGSYDLSTTVNRGSFIPGHYIYLDAKVTARNSGVNVPTFFNDGKFTNGIIEITSSAAINNFKTIVIEPFLTSPFEGTDCDVLYGNASQPVFNPFLQDIDYGNGQIIPINNEAIISGSATKGTVPESYYTALSSVILKYNGSKIQSQKYNIFTEPLEKTDFDQPFNIGTYGRTPSISVNQSLVGFVNFIRDLTPLIDGVVQAEIKYLINSQGDAVSPNLSDITILDSQHNFTDGGDLEVSLIEPPSGSGMQVLNGIKRILKGGYRVEPILFTQVVANQSQPESIIFETSISNPVQDLRNEVSLDNIITYNFNTITTVLFNNVQTTLPGSALYNSATGKYTINATAEASGVTLVMSTQIRGYMDGPYAPSNVIGPAKVSLVQKRGSIETKLQTVDWNPGFIGISDPATNEYSPLINIALESGQYLDGDEYFVTMDTTNFTSYLYKVITIVSLSTQYGTSDGNFDISQIPSTVNISPVPAAAMPIWGVDSSNRTIITSSIIEINQSYGFLKQKRIISSSFTASGTPALTDETQQLFTVKPGDEIKFEGQESKVFTVVNVQSPSQSPTSELLVELDREVSPAIDLNLFLLRRFEPDGSSVIFNQIKPPGPSGTAFIKPRFTTEALNKDVDQFIQDLKSKNLLT